MTTLTWKEIFVDASILDGARLLEQWPHTVTGRVRLIGASAFGDLFFERPDGSVQRLDVLGGGVDTIATSLEQFDTLMNDPAWQAENLLTEGIALLAMRGIVKHPDQFFAIAPHPALTGKIIWERVMAMNAVIWHSICAQILDKPQA